MISLSVGVFKYLAIFHTNLYAWCGNNPVSRVDPSGESFWSDLIRSATRALSHPRQFAYRAKWYAGNFGKSFAKGVATTTNAIKRVVPKVVATGQAIMSRRAPLSVQIGTTRFPIGLAKPRYPIASDGMRPGGYLNIRAFASSGDVPDSCLEFGSNLVGNLPVAGQIIDAAEQVDIFDDYSKVGFIQTAWREVEHVQKNYVPVVSQTYYVKSAQDCADDAGWAPHRCMGCHARTGLEALHPEVHAQNPMWPWFFTNEALGYSSNW